MACLSGKDHGKKRPGEPVITEESVLVDIFWKEETAAGKERVEETSSEEIESEEEKQKWKKLKLRHLKLPKKFRYHSILFLDHCK